MSEYSNIITEENIKNYGERARNDFSSIRGNCGKIADRFESFLIDYEGLPYREKEFTDKYGVRHVRVGPNGEEKHFLFIIDGLFIKKYFKGEDIWIDLSFDQFNDKNKENELVSVSFGSKDSIDNVRIMKPDDNRLSQYSFVGERLFS